MQTLFLRKRSSYWPKYVCTSLFLATLAPMASASSDFYKENLIESTVVQQQNVTGQVLDINSNQPVAGATVKVKGKDVADQTNDDGEFSIEASVGDVLEVTVIGYQTEEYEVDAVADNIIFITNAEEAVDEVVVVGYGTMKRKEVTSAVASVEEEDFNKGGMRNPLDLVQGKVAGLNVTRQHGSNPNSGTSIQLRGMSSLSGATSPLVVIDGIPGGNLDLVKQGDIESIDVLKDG